MASNLIVVGVLSIYLVRRRSRISLTNVEYRGFFRESNSIESGRNVSKLEGRISYIIPRFVKFKMVERVRRKATRAQT